MVLGAPCKYLRGGGPWYAQVARYLGCEGGADYVCGFVCEHIDECKAVFNAVANSPLDLKYLPAGF